MIDMGNNTKINKKHSTSSHLMFRMLVTLSIKARYTINMAKKGVKYDLFDGKVDHDDRV